MENQSKKPSPSLAALFPFLVFVLVYMVTGIVLNHLGVEMAFYQVPAPAYTMERRDFNSIFLKTTKTEIYAKK